MILIKYNSALLFDMEFLCSIKGKFIEYNISVVLSVVLSILPFSPLGSVCRLPFYFVLQENLRDQLIRVTVYSFLSSNPLSLPTKLFCSIYQNTVHTNKHILLSYEFPGMIDSFRN